MNQEKIGPRCCHSLTQTAFDADGASWVGKGRQCRGSGEGTLCLRRQTTRSDHQLGVELQSSADNSTMENIWVITCEDHVIEDLRVDEAVLSASSKLASKAGFGGI